VANPLESSHLKLRRAVEHLKQTEAETQLFVDSNPYVPVVTYDFDTGDHAVLVRVLGEPPLRLGLLAGDTLHNIRSALDHLIYQLAGLDPETPRGEKTQYPIFDLRDKFDQHAGPYLEGVPKAYQALIREAQPYKPRYALLGPLARLDNRDKHRIVEPLASSAVSLVLHANPPDSIWDIRGPEDVLYFDDRAVLARFRSKGEVDMELRNFGYFVRFGPRDEVGIDSAGMHLLIDRVAEILAYFRPAFD
jgi:hypothetical protein